MKARNGGNSAASEIPSSSKNKPQMPPAAATTHELVRETFEDGEMIAWDVFVLGGSETDPQNDAGTSGILSDRRGGRSNNDNDQKPEGKGWGSRRGGARGRSNTRGEGGGDSAEETAALGAEHVCTLVPGATAIFEVAATAPEQVLDGPTQMQARL